LFTDGSPEHSLLSIEVILLLNLEKISKHLFLLLANVQQLLSTAGKIPLYIQFRAKFDADMLFFHVCHFLVTTRSQMEHNIGTFNMTLLSSHTCYSLIPSRK
jgi:hypothetical protein